MTIINGTPGPDTLTGTALADELYGLGGDDVLKGLAGKDKLDGDIGNDTLEGGADNDTLIGGLGNDFLNGGKSDDVMTGGQGNDVYILEANDTIVELAGEGTDTIQTERNNISLADFDNVEVLTLTHGALKDPAATGRTRSTATPTRTR